MSASSHRGPGRRDSHWPPHSSLYLSQTARWNFQSHQTIGDKKKPESCCNFLFNIFQPLNSSFPLEQGCWRLRELQGWGSGSTHWSQNETAFPALPEPSGKFRHLQASCAQFCCPTLRYLRSGGAEGSGTTCLGQLQPSTQWPGMWPGASQCPQPGCPLQNQRWGWFYCCQTSLTAGSAPPFSNTLRFWGGGGSGCPNQKLSSAYVHPVTCQKPRAGFKASVDPHLELSSALINSLCTTIWNLKSDLI